MRRTTSRGPADSVYAGGDVHGHAPGASRYDDAPEDLHGEDYGDDSMYGSYGPQDPYVAYTPPPATAAPLQPRRQRWRWGVGLLGLVAAGISLLSFSLALRPFLAGPTWRLHHVEFALGSRLGASELLNQAELQLGQLIWTVRLKTVAARLKAHPWVQSVSVQRRLPDALRIRVVEHVPRLLVAQQRLWLADAEGTLFKPYETSDGLPLPVLTGAPRDDAEGATQTVRQALALADRLAVASAQLGSLDELHVDEAMGWSAIVRHPLAAPSGARLHLGHTPLERVAAAEQAFVLLIARGEQARAVWADGDQHSDRIHVERM